MNLATYQKQAILMAIMADVPTTSDQELQEEAQRLLLKAMSVAARNTYKKSPKALRTCYVDNSYGFTCSRQLICGDADCSAALQPLYERANARKKVKSDLKAAIDGCRTRKQFIDRFPEFSKYAPAEHGVCKTLPAVSSVVASLVELGWKQTIAKA